MRHCQAENGSQLLQLLMDGVLVREKAKNLVKLTKRSLLNHKKSDAVRNATPHAISSMNHHEKRGKLRQGIDFIEGAMMSHATAYINGKTALPEVLLSPHQELAASKFFKKEATKLYLITAINTLDPVPIDKTEQLEAVEKAKTRVTEEAGSLTLKEIMLQFWTDHCITVEEIEACMEAQVELRDIALATATTLPKPKHLKKQGQKRGILYLTSTGLIDGEMGSSHKKKRKKRGPNKSKSVVAC